MSKSLEVIIGVVFMGWLTVLTFMIATASGRVDVASQRIDQMYSSQAEFAADIAATRTTVEHLRSEIAEIKEITRRIDANVQRASLDGLVDPILAGGKFTPYQTLDQAVEGLRDAAEAFGSTEARPLGTFRLPDGTWTTVYPALESGDGSRD